MTRAAQHVRRGLIWGAPIALTAVSSLALAQAPAATSQVTADAAPVLGTSGALPWGWNQIVVRVQNNGAQPARGQIEVSMKRYGDGASFTASAPYSAGAGASVNVRVPVQVSPFGDVQVSVLDEEDQPLASQSFPSTAQRSAILFDVGEGSRLRQAINDVPLAPSFAPIWRGSSPSSAALLSVGQPRVDAATGAPLLPDRAALYSAADAVLLRTDTLVRLQGSELDALAGFVLAGGTLALATARPEDLRHPTLVALVGGEVTKAAVPPEALRELAPPTMAGGPGREDSALPETPRPTDAIAESLAGWAGGNLRPSVYGSSAFYGLGEVHLLAFDPTRPKAADDPWVRIRVADLVRRAYDRRSTLVFRLGDESMAPDLNRVRRELDPNEGSRWAIGLSAILLCIYAVLAGPINFAVAAKRGRPLRALSRLPLYSALAFAAIVGVGVSAKGVHGRARRLTLVEAGAGMTKGAARRFRGFFVPSADELTVRTTDASSVVSTAIVAALSERRDRLVVDRDGARLVEVSALPWQTVVVREDGFCGLGDGIALLPDESGGGVTLVNRSGRDLRGAVLWLPPSDARYFARIADGERVSSDAGVDLSTRHDGGAWLTHAGASRRVGGLDIHDLGAFLLSTILERDAPGLGGAWWAIEEAAGDAVDWFPEGVPVLLGQLDGGEGRTTDAGLVLESDRLLVRVVGFGGRP